MTPLTENYTTLNYIRDQKFPAIIVTSPRLGSLNHTLLTLEMCRNSQVDVAAIAYNKFNIEDNLICEDTKRYLKNYLEKNLNKCLWIEFDDGLIDSADNLSLQKLLQ